MAKPRSRAVLDKTRRTKSRMRTAAAHRNDGWKTVGTADVDVTYIISAFDRPTMLAVCLWSIKGQSHENFECIVADNADDPAIAAQHARVVRDMRDARFRHVRTFKKIPVSECYWAGEWVAQHLAKGRWLCFPCDDCYYLPEFAKLMLTAAVAEQSKIVMSEFVLMGPEAAGGSGVYQRWKSIPHKLIKSAFLIQRSAFPGFKEKPKASMPSAADTALGTELVRAGFKFAVCQAMTVVHN